MFGLLKKKLNDFSNKLKNKIEDQPQIESKKENIQPISLGKTFAHPKEIKQPTTKIIKEKAIFKKLKKEINQEELAIKQEKIETEKTLEEIKDIGYTYKIFSKKYVVYRNSVGGFCNSTINSR
jgi:hypothetical protein